jgi:hypothetical protein
VGGVDDEQLHETVAAAFSRGHHADARIAPDERGLVVAEEHRQQLVGAGRIGQRSPAQRGDGVDRAGVEYIDGRH